MTRARDNQAGPWRDRPADYGRLSRLLHWLFAGLLLIGVPLGITGANLPLGPMQVVVLTVHKSIGVAVLGLLLTRFIWRLGQGWPAPLAGPAWIAPAARASHWALYALSLTAVLSGWAYSSAVDFPVSLFGLFELPPLTAPDKALAAPLLSLHRLVVYLLLTLIVLHMTAAAYHHLILKDRTLKRMLGK